MNEAIRRKLKEARRRLVLGDFLQVCVWALLTGFSALFCLRLLWSQIPPVAWVTAITLPLAAVLAVAAWRWRQPQVVAIELDARGHTKDRFLTALRLDPANSTSFAQAARHEVANFAATWSPKEHLPLRLDGWRFLWLLVPLAAWLALGLWQDARRARLQPEATEAAARVETIRKIAEASKNEEIRKAAEELKALEEHLKSSSEPLRDAMRALADLERRLAQSSDSLSAQDMADLANALAAASPPTAEALRSGRTGEAAEQIAQMDPEALKQALQQAEQHLQNAKLREMLRQGGSEMRRQLVSMMQSSGQDGEPGESQRLRSMIRDQKNGNGGTGRQEQASGGKEGLPPGDNPPGKEKSTAGRGDDAPPGGGPGSEKDSGRGKTAEGEKDPTDANAQEDFLAGQMGDGTSLVQAFRSSGNQGSVAARAYKDAYDTAASAALDAVNREEIAPGSRFLVRRYFESIRPKE